MEKDASEANQDGPLEEWAAKHEVQELKEGMWLEPFQAVLSRKTNEAWTDKHRHVTRKLVVEGGWVQKRLYDIGFVRRKEAPVTREMAQRNTGCTTVFEGSQKPDPEKLCQWEHTAKTSKLDCKWQRGITSRPLSEGHWKKSHLAVRRWESEKHEKVGAFRLKVFGTMSPPMALLGVSDK